MASAVIGVAILAGMAKMPVPRGGGMALARLDRHKAFRAVRKALELEGSVRIGRKQEGRY